jgi:hypothetical protein
MSTDSFWNCIAAIAATLENEYQVNQTEIELRQMPLEQRDIERARMRLIISQLARVEMRLAE